jgi:hypothetical protein
MNQVGRRQDRRLVYLFCLFSFCQVNATVTDGAVAAILIVNVVFVNCAAPLLHILQGC